MGATPQGRGLPTLSLCFLEEKPTIHIRISTKETNMLVRLVRCLNFWCHFASESVLETEGYCTYAAPYKIINISSLQCQCIYDCYFNNPGTWETGQLTTDKHGQRTLEFQQVANYQPKGQYMR